MPALSQLFDFLYPPRCAACGTQLASEPGRRVCARCVARVELVPNPRCEVCGGPLESATSDAMRCARCLAHPPRYRIARTIARYRTTAEDEPGSLPALIRRHKYGLDQSVGRALVEYMGDELPLSAGDYDVVIPVPLHWRRLWWRGFNQAALLAAEVAHRLNLPLDTTAMSRRRFTPPQTAQHHGERIKNVRRAFTVTNPERVTNRRILLVDDVMTTGATVDECARALTAAGATSVDVFTLARVL
ncbi:MAG TPA: ComF family protein [Candidatus Acidoferrum sp.]|nr:ComF family protein [Candidatus Acidoferrum sp.]